MTQAENIANGNMRCDCKDVKFTLNKQEKRVMKSKANWINDYVDLITGNIKYKIRVRWLINCSKCSQLYMATELKRDAINNIKISGISLIKPPKD